MQGTDQAARSAALATLRASRCILQVWGLDEGKKGVQVGNPATTATYQLHCT
jgi:hypothetical protein